MSQGTRSRSRRSSGTPDSRRASSGPSSWLSRTRRASIQAIARRQRGRRVLLCRLLPQALPFGCAAWAADKLEGHTDHAARGGVPYVVQHVAEGGTVSMQKPAIVSPQEWQE